MKQAASMKDLVVPILLPGIKINTSPTDFYPIQAVQLARFDGETWKLFGDVLATKAADPRRPRASADEPKQPPGPRAFRRARWRVHAGETARERAGRPQPIWAIRDIHSPISTNLGNHFRA